MPGFDAVSVHMEYMVDKVAMCQAPLPLPRRSPTSVISPKIRSLISLSRCNNIRKFEISQYR
jgi:hypothetical protein